MRTELDNIEINNFIDSKRKRMEEICFDPKVRQRITDYLFKLCDINAIDKGDVAVVLGTSLKLYPDKFKKRVYWAAMLWHKKKVNRILFTGKGDHETDDASQAMDARDMAFTEFKVDVNLMSTVGGDNTQENALEAKQLIKFGENVFLVSDIRHLIRGLTVTRSVLEQSARVFPHPVGGRGELDPNDPRTVIELIKAEGYNHTSYRVSSSFSDEQQKYIKDEVYKTIRYYEVLLREQIIRDGKTEEPFEEWFNNLPQDYKIN